MPDSFDVGEDVFNEDDFNEGISGEDLSDMVFSPVAEVEVATPNVPSTDTIFKTKYSPHRYNTNDKYILSEIRKNSRLNFVNPDTDLTVSRFKRTDTIRITPEDKKITMFGYKQPVYLKIDDYISFTLGRATIYGKIKEFNYVDFDYGYSAPYNRRIEKSEERFKVISIVINYISAPTPDKNFPPPDEYFRPDHPFIQLTDVNNSKHIFFSINKLNNKGKEIVNYGKQPKDPKMEPLAGGKKNYTKRRKTKKTKRQTKKRKIFP